MAGISLQETDPDVWIHEPKKKDKCTDEGYKSGKENRSVGQKYIG